MGSEGTALCEPQFVCLARSETEVLCFRSVDPQWQRSLSPPVNNNAHDNLTHKFPVKVLFEKKSKIFFLK